MAAAPTAIYLGEQLAQYGFGDGHPFGPDRHRAFAQALEAASLTVEIRAPVRAGESDLLLFHDPDYVVEVDAKCETGSGYLDGGDTPALPGINNAGRWVVGTAVSAADAIMAGSIQNALVPIAGLHHAGRAHAAGFCVFDDCGVVIEVLRHRHGLKRVAYVDIDAHHGDGVFYAFEDDADLLFADMHEDGRVLYPGTGHRAETGRGAATDTKLNIPMPPGAGDEQFLEVWSEVLAYLEAGRPEFIVLQCGADSLAGDPITHLSYTEAAHGRAAADLRDLAERHCGGKLLALGGGGYNLDNLARAWVAVARSLAA
jgi:acetoin utilization protein AcuC